MVGFGLMGLPPQGGGSVGSSSITDDSIANVDINSAAAILLSKLENLDSAKMIIGSAGNVPTEQAITGDITVTNAGLTAIGAVKVLEGMIASDAVDWDTKIKAGVDGEVPTWDASGNPSRAAVGTAGQVFTSNGVGAAPTMQTLAAGGAFEEIAEGNGSMTGGEAEQDTVTLAASALSNNDLIIVTWCRSNDAENNNSVIIRIDDDTGTLNLTDNSSNSLTHRGFVIIGQAPRTGSPPTGAIIQGNRVSSGGVDVMHAQGDLINNWITSQFHIKLLALSTGTVHWKWKVWKSIT